MNNIQALNIKGKANIKIKMQELIRIKNRKIIIIIIIIKIKKGTLPNTASVQFSECTIQVLGTTTIHSLSSLQCI